jgi:hypothetical protein
MLASLKESVGQDPINVVELGIPGLRHFMFRIHSTNIFIESNPLPPYTCGQDRKRLMRLYQESNRLLQLTNGKLYYHVTDNETAVYKVFLQ